MLILSVGGQLGRGEGVLFVSKACRKTCIGLLRLLRSGLLKIRRIRIGI